MAASTAVHRACATMERTNQWAVAMEIPSDIVIHVGDSTFPLHKFTLVSKSGYIRRKVVELDRSDLRKLELNGIPGGADAFEKAARFCYGVNFEISVQNVAALLCAAEWLEMTEKTSDGNLVARAEEFLSRPPSARFPARSPFSSHARGFFPSRRNTESFSAALKPSDPSPLPAPKTLSTAIVVFASKSLPDLLPLSSGGSRGPSSYPSTDRARQRGFLESLVAILSTNRDTPLPVGFLCCLLRAAIFLESSTASCREVERRISFALDEAAVGDLMTIAFDYSGQRLTDLDSIRRIVTGFSEREVVGAVAQRAARTVDSFIAEIATEEELAVSKFAGIAGALSKAARRFDDDLYRAVDIYLKAHPGLDEIEREKACSVMDPLRLSYEARLHASQNKRLPLQVVLHALYYDQLKLRSGGAEEAPLAVRSGRGRAEEALAKENEALRSELARMKLYLVDMQKVPGNGVKALMPPVSEIATGSKKTTFFSSVSRKLGKLNPFRQGSKDTSSIEESGSGERGEGADASGF
ncbi:hypothetical protein HPP92_019256 [Vanilla planifolia]|uniref:Root phototropism protein 2 n=1 Tax=Vanilla planifolia TaxID=51239 RepID=A0A835Q979_VANPL|nr:hypothetical protein HPP92_019256 [Vanilla planifolia]